MNDAEFVATVTNGLAALMAAGHTPEIVGMLWTQGEKDAVERSAAGWSEAQIQADYQANLTNFIAVVRSQFGVPNLPFLLSRLSVGQTANAPAGLAGVRAAQSAVAASDPHAYLINTDPFPILADNQHFSGAGQLALGQAFAQISLQDDDGDRFTNGQEWAAGTSPRNGNSFPRIASLILDASTLRLRFLTVTGRQYQVLWRDSLTAGEWSNLGSPATGNGAEQELTDTPPVGSMARFYKLLITKP